MKFNLRFLSLLSLFFVSSTFCDVIFPVGIIQGAGYSLGFLIFFLILCLIAGIESIFFYFFVKVKALKAFWISFVANLISSFSGTITMVVFSKFLVKGNLAHRIYPSTYSLILFYFSMWILSLIIELIVIRFIFNFELKKLILPVGLANIVSYFVVWFINNSFKVDFSSSGTAIAMQFIVQDVIKLAGIILPIYFLVKYVVYRLVLKFDNAKLLTFLKPLTINFFVSFFLSFVIYDTLEFTLLPINIYARGLAIFKTQVSFLIFFLVFTVFYTLIETLILKYKKVNIKDSLIASALSNSVIFGSVTLFYIGTYFRLFF